jgi:hypothetical protein
MKTILKIEELAQFVLGIFLFATLDFDWWVFPALLLTPDIGMLGYVLNPKFGAFFYNFFHHKAVAIAVMILGYLYLGEWATLMGIVLFSHASFDRIFGYGLKFEDSFKHTHLGTIGKD